MPGSESELWVNNIKVYDSNLSAAQRDLFVACLQSKVIHRRMPIKEDKYKRSPTHQGGFSTNFDFAWPIEFTPVFQFLQSGYWPGFPPPSDN
jgi:hypothetical protein